LRRARDLWPARPVRLVRRAGLDIVPRPLRGAWPMSVSWPVRRAGRRRGVRRDPLVNAALPDGELVGAELDGLGQVTGTDGGPAGLEVDDVHPAGVVELEAVDRAAQQHRAAIDGQVEAEALLRAHDDPAALGRVPVEEAGECFPRRRA